MIACFHLQGRQRCGKCVCYTGHRIMKIMWFSRSTSEAALMFRGISASSTLQHAMPLPLRPSPIPVCECSRQVLTLKTPTKKHFSFLKRRGFRALSCEVRKKLCRSMQSIWKDANFLIPQKKRLCQTGQWGHYLAVVIWLWIFARGATRLTVVQTQGPK